MRPFLAFFLAYMMATPGVSLPQLPGAPHTFAGVIGRPFSTSSGTLITKRINSGGGSYTDGSGNVWEADSGCGQHQTYSVTDAIGSTTDDALYQNENWGDGLDATTGFPVLDCSYNVPAGLYTVTLKFAEIYFGVNGVAGGAGYRVFDIYVNGVLVENDYDTMSTSGALNAQDRSYPNVDAASGTISIHLISSGPNADNPHISAIQLTQTTSAGGGGGTQTTRLLHTYLPGGACPSSINTDVASQVQDALTATGNNERIVFDCMVGLGSDVVLDGRTGTTIDASAGGGVAYLGTPSTNEERFKVQNCTDCTVKNMTFDMNFKNALGFMSNANTNLTFQNNTIKNNGAFSGGAVWFRAGTNNHVLDNQLVNIQPIFQSPGVVFDVSCRGFWIGEGGGYERGTEVARNITHSSGHTFIAYSGVSGWIHDNFGDGLLYEGVKISSNGDYPNPGTTIIENNEFHGSLAGWHLTNGQPVNGGHLQFGMAGNGLESMIVRFNTWDGGSQGMGFVGQVGNVDMHHNKIVNQWDTGVLIQNNSHGAIHIHHNFFGAPRGQVVTATPLPVVVRIMSDTGQNYTINNVTVDNNWISQGWQFGFHFLVRSGSVSGVTINNNAFVDNKQQAIYIENPGGTVSTPSIGSGATANCFSNNNGGGDSIFDSRGILTSQPTQVSSCSNPSGVTYP